mmetsp:Transcript_25141/g.58465  ORF Transcript_25141/g.58465 Transcript_25141/m.58465 type:complete len:229 (-) Transcript_25141:48-734(-)
MSVTIHKQSTVDSQDMLDLCVQAKTFFEAVLLALQEFHHDNGRIVKCDQSSTTDPMGFPLCLHQVGTLQCAILVICRRVRISLADILNVETGACLVGLVEKFLDFCISEGSVGETRHHREPTHIGILVGTELVRDPLKNRYSGSRFLGDDAFVLRIKVDSTPLGEPFIRLYRCFRRHGVQIFVELSLLFRFRVQCFRLENLCAEYCCRGVSDPGGAISLPGPNKRRLP